MPSEHGCNRSRALYATVHRLYMIAASKLSGAPFCFFFSRLSCATYTLYLTFPLPVCLPCSL